MALIVCGFMVLSLTIAIVTIEVRTQVAERLNGNDPLTLNVSSQSQIKIYIFL